MSETGVGKESESGRETEQLYRLLGTESEKEKGREKGKGEEVVEVVEVEEVEEEREEVEEEREEMEVKERIWGVFRC